MKIIKLQDMPAIAAALPPEVVVAYGRKSTKNESSSKSLNDQRECCFEQAQDEHIPLCEEMWWPEQAGHGGDEWWEGGGVSGLEDETAPKARTRPIFTKIMRGVIKRTIRCVIVYSLDRLWRSAAIAGQAIDLMVRHGVLLLDRNGFVDIYSAEGRAYVLNNAVTAQAHREHAAVASPRGVRKSREKGKLIGQGHCLGFRAVGGRTGKVRHIEEEQEVVRRIFRLYLTGENGSGPLSPDLIADLLMGEGFIWTPDLHEKRSIVRSEYTRNVIYDEQVRRTLTDVRYIGRQRHEGKEWPCPPLLNNGQPVVPYELFFKVQEKIKERAHGSRATVNKVALTGRVRCGIHGLPLGKQQVTVTHKDGTKEIRSYWLGRTIRGRDWCRHSLPSVRVEDLDQFIVDVLAPLILAEIANKGAVHDPDSVAAQASALEREIARRQDWLEHELPKQVMKAQLGESDAYDEATLRATARQMSLDIDRLGSELRKLVTNDDDQMLAARLRNIKDITPADRIDAIRATIRWVAVLPNEEALANMRNRPRKPADNMGSLVFLTRWGTYFTARLYRHAGVHGNRCHLRFATPEEAIGGVADFPDPEAFYRGLERGYLGKAYEFDPREVTPGYEPSMPMPEVEFDLSDDMSRSQPDAA